MAHHTHIANQLVLLVAALQFCYFVHINSILQQ